MVLGVVAGLKNGEVVMAGVVGGDCRDKMNFLLRAVTNVTDTLPPGTLARDC